MNKRKGLLATLLAMLVTIAGISAYFTDSETVTNTFTVGKIDVKLTEPSWEALPDTNGNDIPDVAESIVPNQTIAKDPKVTNTGNNDAYVFLEVTVPYGSYATAEADGTPKAAAEIELFSYTVNPGWVELGTGTKDTTKNVIKHVYAYGTASTLSTLSKSAATAALFNEVTFVNLVEGQNVEGLTKTINVTAKAIQAEGLTETTPAKVYEVINTQAGE